MTPVLLWLPRLRPVRQRHLHVHQRRPGAKARELEALRRVKRERAQAAAPEQVALTWEGEPAVYVLEEPAIETTLGAALATAPEAAAPGPAPVRGPGSGLTSNRGRTGVRSHK